MYLGSPADLRRRFRTGRPCLDLVHTGGEGALARWEIVHSPDDLGRLLGVVLGLPPLPADEADLAAMRPLRTAMTHLAYGLAASGNPRPADGDAVGRLVDELAAGAPRPADIAVLNAAAAAPPLVPALRPEGSGSRVVDPTAAAALATIARDAVDLFGGPLAQRIRVCDAEDCGLLFVDTSRPGRRRWCSMERCGNRAKIRTHRARRSG
ncbi:CGNR zinc finger domain-containing protein [Pseudonocardia hierapolitana]|nr:CGNR zinc finger domain-containing protein [Pseudonocardia hierapolitana]